MNKAILWLACLTTAFMTGCATTTTLKQEDCTHADWQQVGRTDGERGVGSQGILRHAKTCQGLATPDKVLWERGRQEGLKSYCTPNNAYNIGRMGYTLNAVCDDSNPKTLEELHRANMMGLEQYEMRERMSYYPYGYGGWYYPWFAPYRPYWW